LERCVILGKLERHSEAIKIFLHKLNRRIDFAEEYCSENYDLVAPRSVYSILFAELLEFKDQGSMSLEDTLIFVVKHAQFLEIKEVCNDSYNY
jgi:hypothetical protein